MKVSVSVSEQDRARARQLALRMPMRTDARGHKRFPTATSVIARAVALGLEELEKRCGVDERLARDVLEQRASCPRRGWCPDDCPNLRGELVRYCECGDRMYPGHTCDRCGMTLEEATRG